MKSIAFLCKLFRIQPQIKGYPIGLAAGFDKNGTLLHTLPYFGFQFSEVGTVTPKPQGGNPRPRLFRKPEERALFNRMGFNNLGAEIVAHNIRKAKASLPIGFKVGVNLGKNRDTPDHEAHLDYAKAAAPFLDCADYFVINVSSPNTPGLRALQTPEHLSKIYESVLAVVTSSGKNLPIWIKLAPELNDDDLQMIISTLDALGVSGYVLTNTLGGVYIYREESMTGGYSGGPLTEKSLSVLRKVKSLTSRPVQSVGGVLSIQDAKARKELGADGIQVYTGFVYEGPGFIFKLRKALQ